MNKKIDDFVEWLCDEYCRDDIDFLDDEHMPIVKHKLKQLFMRDFKEKPIKKFIHKRLNKFGRFQYYFSDVLLNEAKLKDIPNRMWVSQDKLEYYAHYNNYDLQGLSDSQKTG